MLFFKQSKIIFPRIGMKRKQEHHRVVPTWNYRVVHVKGQIKLMEDDQYLRGVLARLTRTHEESQENPWRMGDAPNDFIAEQLEKNCCD